MKSEKLFEQALQDYEEKYSKLEYENLKITFSLETPLVYLLSLHLDGLLAGMVFQKILSEYKIYWHISFNKILYEIPVPIEKETYPDYYNGCMDWFYKASNVQYMREPIIKKTSFKKRFSEKHLNLLDCKSLYIDRGWTKNYDMPVPYIANNWQVYFY